MKTWICSALMLSPAFGLTIVVDYTYDTNDFFGAGNPGGATAGAEAKAALEAAAARWSAIIDQTLLPADASYGSDWRIGFTHPGTGNSFQLSTAASEGSDLIAGLDCDPADGIQPCGPADVYDSSFALAADEWRLFAGGRALGSGGVGGTGTGINVSTTFSDPDSPLNRGFNVGFGTLPVWGGAISFDDDGSTTWHFDHTVSSPGSSTDFYSIALHEIGHALGLSVSFNDWEANVTGSDFIGPNALAAYNADNSTSLTSILLQSSAPPYGYNPHWLDDTYGSFIFPAGSPNYVGTVGAGVLQDLIMEPIANFVFPGLRRFEVTNTDVGAVQDVGWSVIGTTLDPPKIITIVQNGSGQPTLTWTSEPGASYSVSWSGTLASFTDFGVTVPSGGATTSYQDTSSSGIDKRFYQVERN